MESKSEARSTKMCKKCQEEKELSDFYRNCYRKGGYLSVCKPCNLKYQKEYYGRKHPKVNGQSPACDGDEREDETLH